MALVDIANNPNDPNNPNALNPLQANQAQGTNQPIPPSTTGGAGPVTATGAANVTGQVVGTANPSQPFQNISQYLTANAPQSANLANQVAQSVSGPAAQTTADITKAANTFQNSVNAGYTPENTGLINAVSANPVSVAANPNDVAAFQAQLNDIYKGPTDITATPGYANLPAEVANAQALGTSAQTPTGIQTLLRNIEGPTTQGVNNLDAMLLALNPQNFQTIKNAGLTDTAANNTLGNFLTGQTTEENAAAQNAITNAQNISTKSANAINTASTNLQNAVNPELATAKQQAIDFNNLTNDILMRFNTGQRLTPQEFDILDITSKQASDPFQQYEAFTSQSGNMDALIKDNIPSVSPEFWNQYYTPKVQITAPTLSNVMTPDQISEAQALQTLTGTAPSGIPTTAGIPFSVPTTPGNLDVAAGFNNLLSIVQANPNIPFQSDIVSTLMDYLGIPIPQPPVNNPPPITGGPVQGGLPPPVTGGTATGQIGMGGFTG